MSAGLESWKSKVVCAVELAEHEDIRVKAGEEHEKELKAKKDCCFYGSSHFGVCISHDLLCG